MTVPNITDECQQQAVYFTLMKGSRSFCLPAKRVKSYGCRLDVVYSCSNLSALKWLHFCLSLEFQNYIYKLFYWTVFVVVTKIWTIQIHIASSQTVNSPVLLERVLSRFSGAKKHPRVPCWTVIEKALRDICMEQQLASFSKTYYSPGSPCILNSWSLTNGHLCRVALSGYTFLPSLQYQNQFQTTRQSVSISAVYADIPECAPCSVTKITWQL